MAAMAISKRKQWRNGGEAGVNGGEIQLTKISIMWRGQLISEKRWHNSQASSAYQRKLALS
jgi:hypothetical protein